MDLLAIVPAPTDPAVDQGAREAGGTAPAAAFLAVLAATTAPNLSAWMPGAAQANGGSEVAEPASIGAAPTSRQPVPHLAVSPGPAVLTEEGTDQPAAASLPAPAAAPTSWPAALAPTIGTTGAAAEATSDREALPEAHPDPAAVDLEEIQPRALAARPGPSVEVAPRVTPPAPTAGHTAAAVISPTPAGDPLNTETSPLVAVEAPVEPDRASAMATAPAPVAPLAATEPATVAPTAPRGPVTLERVLALQVVDHLTHISRADGQHELTVRLDPPELGQLELRVRVEGGVVHLEIGAASGSTTDLLRHAVPDLRAVLEEAGLTAGDLDVSHHHGHEGRSEPRGAETATDASIATSPAPTIAQPQPVVARPGGLDLLI